MFEKAKGLQICKTLLKKKFGAWKCLYLDEEMYLVSHCHVKKIAVKFDILVFNKYFFYYFYFIVIIFLIKKSKIYKDSYFHFLRLNVGKYVLKTIAKLK